MTIPQDRAAAGASARDSERSDITSEAVAKTCGWLRLAEADEMHRIAAMLEAIQADNEALRAALDGTAVLPMLERARAEARQDTAIERAALSARVVELEGQNARNLQVASELAIAEIDNNRAEARAEALEEAAKIIRAWREWDEESRDMFTPACTSSMADALRRKAAEARQAAEPRAPGTET